LKNVGRVVAFSLALFAVIITVGGTWSFLAGHAFPGAGAITIGLCGVSSPDRLAIGLYLDANASQLEQPAGTDDTPVKFTVEPGETVADISTRLKNSGLVSDAELFRRYVQYHGLDAGIEAGEFSLRQTMTIPEIGQALQEGQRPEQVVTVLEGLRLEQVAGAVAAQTSIREQDFLSLVTTGWRELGLEAQFDFLADVPPSSTLEGFLFPETYRLPEDATAVHLLSRMLETFAARVPPDLRAAAAGRGLNTYELVSLASIIEREAVLDEERPLIAGVFYNRLDASWLLESCPTVQYGLGTQDDWWPSLTLDQLDIPSPSNTYQNPGLPPGPICSPGLASIQAAAYPAETEYYFFLADCTKGDGSHLFSATAEEHIANYEMCGSDLP
jgi:UPF0755 protein